VHHTEYLEGLVAEGRLEVEATESSVTYHDPCYLGRHSGVYDAPRNVLRVLTNDFVELERKRENSFCCGAGGAQFWKEEEAGEERISDNRFREAEGRLASRGENKVLAVGCPFCKSMLESTPGKGESSGIAVKDVAELLLESVLRRAGESVASRSVEAAVVKAPVEVVKREAEAVVEPKVEVAAPVEASEVVTSAVVRKKWAPKAAAASIPEVVEPVAPGAPVVAETAEAAPARKKWEPKRSGKPTDSGE
jgi:Cysteine-rich domain